MEQLGPDWYQNSFREPIRTVVRKAIRGKNWKEINQNPDAISVAITNDVTTMLKSTPVQLVSVSTGQVELPDELANAAKETAVKTQAIETQAKELIWQKNRKDIEQAAGEADVAKINAMHGSIRDNIEYIKAQAMKSCAEHQGCVLVIKSDDASGVNVNIPQK